MKKKRKSFLPQNLRPIYSRADPWKNRGQKILRYCPFKGTVAWDFLPPVFFYEPRPDSTAKKYAKIAEMKLSSCELEVADIRKNCDCKIAELRSNISLKSFRITIVDVLPSSCGISIANSKQSCACPPLLISTVSTNSNVRMKQILVEEKSSRWLSGDNYYFIKKFSKLLRVIKFIMF